MSLLGSMSKHVLGGILHAIRAIALAFIIAGVLAAGATEGIAAALTKQFPPSGATHLAAAALFVAVGYAAAVTVAIEEILRTIIKAFEVVLQEAEKLGKEAIGEAEKLGRGALNDAGAVGRGVTGVVGGIVGGVGHEAGRLESGVASHLPGHQSQVTTVTASTPTPTTANR